MEIKEIQDLIDFVAKSQVSEVKYKTKDFEITIKTPLAGPEYPPMPMQMHMQAPMYQAAPAPGSGNSAGTGAVPVENNAQVSDNASSAPTASGEEKYTVIRSPMIGTFYRKASPEKPVFVNVGDEVSPSTVVCVIEAMKLFNQIEAEIKGKIVKILVDDSSPVEYDQPLFLVDPS